MRSSVRLEFSEGEKGNKLFAQSNTNKEKNGWVIMVTLDSNLIFWPA